MRLTRRRMRVWKLCGALYGAGSSGSDAEALMGPIGTPEVLDLQQKAVGQSQETSCSVWSPFA